MANGNGNGKVKTKNNGNGQGAEVLAEAEERIKALEAQLKKNSLDSKYKRVDENGGEFDATKFLFDHANQDEHSREIVTSDLPIRMPPLLTNWETLIEATNPHRTKRLSMVWISKYLLYRIPVDRQSRGEAVTMGQEQKEQDITSRALRA